MKRFLLTVSLLASVAMATDFSQMSTEELVALRGTVTAEDQTTFQEELQSRLSTLTQEERQTLVSQNERTQTRSRAMEALNGNFGSGDMSHGTGGHGAGHGAGQGGGHGGGGHGGNGNGGGMR